VGVCGSSAFASEIEEQGHCGQFHGATGEYFGFNAKAGASPIRPIGQVIHAYNGLVIQLKDK
jgi:hypothetical protein